VVRMTQALVSRRRRMLDAAEMGIKPHTFIKEMAEEAVSNISDPVEREVEYQRAYDRLQKDWYSRRLGPNGWLRKLEEIGEIEDITQRQLYQLRQIQFYSMRMIKDIREMSPMIRNMAMGKLMSSIQMERKILGIRPIIQPDILSSSEIEELEVRLQGDQFYELLTAADPEMAQEIIKKIIRVGDLPEIDFEENR